MTERITIQLDDETVDLLGAVHDATVSATPDRGIDYVADMLIRLGAKLWLESTTSSQMKSDFYRSLLRMEALRRVRIAGGHQ